MDRRLALALYAFSALATGDGRVGQDRRMALGFYAAPPPAGSPAGDGSRRRPWDLATALAGASGRVQPGDTVWLRGGTYRGPFHSTIAGTRTAWVVVRQYPGERATIDGAGSRDDTFVVRGAYSMFWGFEVVNTDPTRCCSTSSNFRADMVTNYAPHTKFINLVVHDGGPGFFVSTAYPDVEIYGSIVYNIGYQGPDRGHGHAMYIKNDLGPVVIRDNVMFNQFGFGVHEYTDRGTGHLNNIQVEGNAIFNSGLLSNNSQSANILAGGGQEPADAISVVDNLTYYPPGFGGKNIQVGPVSDLRNGSMTVRNNYAVGGSTPLYVGNWRRATVTGTTVQPGDTTTVFVRPNAYEPGRAHIVVFNWNRRAAVAVDVSKVLHAGDRYEVRNVQALFGAPVASGTSAGGTITIPMASVTPPAPIGMARSPAPVTGPAFDVFLLTRPVATERGR
ncbi:MAG TPA: hypothetical protein VM716_14430 [Gemmatimonadales bacterium]|nr:hypothetical protein [Gemmatimonadales bacterium]